MGTPDHQTLMLPVMETCADGHEHRARDLVEAMAQRFGLTAEERAQLLPSGRQTIIANRSHWAITYLTKAGLLERPRPGRVRITARGREVLGRKLDRIGTAFLTEFPEFRAFREKSHQGEASAEGEEAPVATKVLTRALEQTPEDQIRAAHGELETVLRDELLLRIRSAEPRFFEQLVVQLLDKMGYGSDLGGSALVVGGSGDGGIDGLIDQDPLGLDRVYVQPKRYAADNPVGSKAILEFSGALASRSAAKGVFLTTSRFTDGARATAQRLPQRIVLIDGDELAKLLIRHDVGVRVAETLAIKRIDEDFFLEE